LDHQLNEIWLIYMVQTGRVYWPRLMRWPLMKTGFEILNRDTGTRFRCGADQSILDAALSQKIGIRYGCAGGRCGACLATLIEGDVDIASGPAAGSASIRLCLARPRSDLVIEAQERPWQDRLPIRRLPARIIEKQIFAEKTVSLRLRLPARETFRYRPGQYIGFSGPDGYPRYFSLARASADDGLIEIHAAHVPGGRFTTDILVRLDVGDVLRFEGPYGDFQIPLDDPRPAVLIGGGTGIAPLKAVVEHAIAMQSARKFHLYWGVRREKDFYIRSTVEDWPRRLPNLDVTLVVSDGSVGDGWPGRRGPVHEAVLADRSDLRGFQVYACGSPAMIAAARRDFTRAGGLPPEDFLADVFSSGPPMSIQTALAV
jgi:CDP-4-dehydro-6-deoxyglucose reductase, E3